MEGIENGDVNPGVYYPDGGYGEDGGYGYQVGGYGDPWGPWGEGGGSGGYGGYGGYGDDNENGFWSWVNGQYVFTSYGGQLNEVVITGGISYVFAD